jgi:hypothetical protein
MLFGKLSLATLVGAYAVPIPIPENGKHENEELGNGKPQTRNLEAHTLPHPTNPAVNTLVGAYAIPVPHTESPNSEPEIQNPNTETRDPKHAIPNTEH